MIGRTDGAAVPALLADQRPPYARYVTALRAAVRRWAPDYALTTYGRARHDGGRRVGLVRILSLRGEGTGGLVVVAGFHGEEPAGPLCLLTFVDQVLGHALRLRVPLAIYPVVHPWGYDHVQRVTVAGELTNAGFVHDEDPISHESALLREELLQRRPLIFLDLHEDAYEDAFYLYSFGDRDLARVLVARAGELCPVKHGPLAREPHAVIGMDGLLPDLHDGSCEDLMCHAGAIGSFAPETPATRPLRQRMHVDLTLIEACLEFLAARADRTPSRPRRTSRPR